MIWIGLTGPMGSGKSTVASTLRDAGYSVTDADQIVGNILESDADARAAIVRAFGADLVGADGRVDRRRLAARVFADPAHLTTLESILHPRVRARVEEIRTRLAAAGHAVAFYDVPLLFERHMEAQFDDIVVVTARPELRLARLIARTGLTAAEIELRWANQLPPEYKEARASVVVRNDGDLPALRAEVGRLLGVLTQKFALAPRPSTARGFSLVEVMVSVAIVSILAVMAVPSYEGLVDKAKYGRARGDLSNIRAAAMGLRAAEDTTLPTAMGTACSCFAEGYTVNSTPVCTSPDWGLSQWQKLGYDKAPADPWGQCYLLDENEGEYGITDCRFDAIVSGGKDQKFAGFGDGDDVSGDDAIMRIPFYGSRPNCTGRIEGQFGGN